MKKTIFQTIILMMLCTFSHGQNISGRLSFLFAKLDTTRADNGRILINDSIRILIDGFAASDSVFLKTFPNLRFLGQITSPDNDLKIINWNLVLSGNSVRYFCYIIKKGDKNTRNSVYRLTGVNTDGPLRNDTTFTAEKWYGALYYDISSVKIKKDIYYMLLGIDIGNNFINRKLIEVLSFRPDGELTFGKKWFDTGKKMIYRVIFEYDATGVMSLKFRSPKTIVFDRLVPLYRDDRDRLTFGAEYTLDGYKFNNGLWKFEPNVDARNKE